jgi:hypothetical protein
VTAGSPRPAGNLLWQILDHELGKRLGLRDYLGIADCCAGELEYQHAIDLAAGREREADATIDQNRPHVFSRAPECDRPTGPVAVATEYGDQSFYVTGAQRCDERIDHASLSREMDLGRGRTLNAPARAARELTRGRGRPANDRCDLIERHRTYIVKHKRDPFRRVEFVEHDEERQPNLVREFVIFVRLREDMLLREQGLLQRLRGAGDAYFELLR